MPTKSVTLIKCNVKFNINQTITSNEAHFQVCQLFPAFFVVTCSKSHTDASISLDKEAMEAVSVLVPDSSKNPRFCIQRIKMVAEEERNSSMKPCLLFTDTFYHEEEEVKFVISCII